MVIIWGSVESVVERGRKSSDQARRSKSDSLNASGSRAPAIRTRSSPNGTTSSDWYVKELAAESESVSVAPRTSPRSATRYDISLEAMTLGTEAGDRSPSVSVHSVGQVAIGVNPSFSLSAMMQMSASSNSAEVAVVVCKVADGESSPAYALPNCVSNCWNSASGSSVTLDETELCLQFGGFFCIAQPHFGPVEVRVRDGRKQERHYDEDSPTGHRNGRERIGSHKSRNNDR